MATMTIRNLPDELHARLKEQAKRNRRSLNQEVIAELEAAPGFPDLPNEEARKKARAEELITKVNELRKGMSRFMTAGEIDAAIEEGRR